MTTKAAVLVNLTIGSFSNEKTDPKVTREVAQSYNANSDAGRYVRKRLPDDVLSKIRGLQREAYNYHKQIAAPWMDGGIRIMAAKLITKALARYKDIDMQIKAEVAKLASELPQIKLEAQKARKGLYHSSDFPTKEQLETAFRLEVEFLPVPLAEDFRIDYISNKIKKDLTDKNAARFSAQTDYLKEQILVLLFRLKRNFLQEAPRVRSTTITQLAWLRDNVKELILDETQLPALMAPLSRIDQVVIAEFDEDARPKFNPLAVDEARVVVDEAIEALS